MESAMISRETRICTDILQEYTNDKQRYRLFSIYIPSSFTSLIKIYEIYDYEQIYDYFEQMKMLKSNIFRFFSFFLLHSYNLQRAEIRFESNIDETTSTK